MLDLYKENWEMIYVSHLIAVDELNFDIYG
uniref:Uncharacterized protein n=1 Tax=Arundo donax TaxID=35708 RepID=A0A0A9GSS4_ARUDO